MQKELFSLSTIVSKEQLQYFKSIQKDMASFRKESKSQYRKFVLLRREHYRKIGVQIPSKRLEYNWSTGVEIDRDLEHGLVHEATQSEVFKPFNSSGTANTARAWNVFYGLCKGRSYREIEQHTNWEPYTVYQYISTTLYYLANTNEKKGEQRFTKRDLVVFKEMLSKEFLGK